MSEVLLCGHGTAAPVHHGSGAPPVCGVEQWIEKIQALDEDTLQLLAPMLDGLDALETLRLAIAMSPSLANPGRGLGARFSRQCDDFMLFAFQLRQLAAFLQGATFASRNKSIPTLETWCRKRLENAAAAHEDTAADLAEWCFEMIARFDPTFGAWLRDTLDRFHKERT